MPVMADDVVVALVVADDVVAAAVVVVDVVAGAVVVDVVAGAVVDVVVATPPLVTEKDCPVAVALFPEASVADMVTP